MSELHEKKMSVSYIVFEGEMVRLERIIKRLWVLCILLVVLLVGSNAMWIWYESQFEYYETTDISQDGEGVNIVSGGNINYGTESYDN